MQHVSSVLLRLCKDIGLEDKMLLQQIEETWHDIFSEPLSLHTYPADLKDGEITINVDSQIWLQQLKFLQPMILKKLDKYNLKSVRLRLGKIKRKSKHKALTKKEKQPVLSKHDTEWLNSLLSEISDAELRESVKRAMQKSICYNYKTKRGEHRRSSF